MTLASLLVFTLSLAQAADEPTADAPAAVEPAPAVAPVSPTPPAASPAAPAPPAPPRVTFGPHVSTASIDLPNPRDLRLGPCLEALPTRDRAPARAADVAMLVQVRIRRGQARLVTVEDVLPGLEPLAPCLERELMRVEWGVRRGDVEVPVSVAPQR